MTARFAVRRRSAAQFAGSRHYSPRGLLLSVSLTLQRHGGLCGLPAGFARRPASESTRAGSERDSEVVARAAAAHARRAVTPLSDFLAGWEDPDLSLLILR